MILVVNSQFSRTLRDLSSLWSIDTGGFCAPGLSQSFVMCKEVIWDKKGVSHTRPRQ